jgi:HlyD family secretion protein
MHLKRATLAASALLIAALILAACGGQASPSLATATITRGELIQSVGGSGKVAPAQSIDLTFGTAGTVAEVRVEEGQRVRQGDTLALLTTADLDQQILQAEANLKSARAALQALKDGPSETDLRAAQAQLAAAQAQLNQQANGNARASDLASAQAQLRSAQADLAALKSPTESDLSAARLKLTQAEINLQSTRDSASAGKTRAQLDMEKAVAALTQAQSRYATALQNWQYVQETGNDPIAPSRTNAQGKREPNTLNGAQRQQYYDSYVQAEASLHSAEDAVAQAQIVYDNARQQEVVDVQLAEAQLADARRQLEALLSPSPQQLAAAEARVAQAQAQLNQLRGGTANDVTVAQSTVEQRQAALDALLAPPSEKDLAQAEANVAQAEANLAKARLNRASAALVAPFSGTVATIGVTAGDQVPGAGQTAAIALVDDSAFHVDVNVSEADVALLSVGQAAQVELDALPGRPLDGTLDYIAPTATTEQNVTTYLARVSLKPTDMSLRVGLSAAVTIVAGRRENVLLIPSGAIRETDSGPQAQVQRGDQTTLVPIELGMSGDTFTEVLGGLEEGDVVVMRGPRPANRGPFG